MRYFCSILILSLALSGIAIAREPIASVRVDNVGNPSDTHGAGYGGVSYEYRIGTYEVTNSQYTDFLNTVDPTGINALGLYNPRMTSDARGGIEFSGQQAKDGKRYAVKDGRGNNPVILVSWYDAARFANWLHNGRGEGGTETGAYHLLGGSASPTNGFRVTRNADARWFLPSENEWYKAAYHKNDGPTGNYWDYPTQSNDEPFSDEPPGSDATVSSNVANFLKHDRSQIDFDIGYAVTGSPIFDQERNYLTDVGAYSMAAGPYGTFDQGGNVWEWIEDGSSTRVGRGGFWSSSSLNLLASQRGGFVPDGEFNDVGFRVATVPEPHAAIFLLTAVIGLLSSRRSTRGK